MTSIRVQAAFSAAILLPVTLSAAPYLIQDLHPDPVKELMYFQPFGMASGPDGISYFSATDPAHGTELWRSDGTSAGTYRVTDICAGRCSSNPASLRMFQGEVYFAADDGLTGSEPWRSDGTPAGTFPLGDLAPGMDASSPGPFTRVRQVVITGADDGAHGREPWAIPLADVLRP